MDNEPKMLEIKTRFIPFSHKNNIITINFNDNDINNNIKLNQPLCYHESFRTDNIRNKTNYPMRSIAERLKEKEGKIRSNLMGMRAEFCGRSVAGQITICEGKSASDYLSNIFTLPQEDFSEEDELLTDYMKLTECVSNLTPIIIPKFYKTKEYIKKVNDIEHKCLIITTNTSNMKKVGRICLVSFKEQWYCYCFNLYNICNIDFYNGKGKSLGETIPGIDKEQIADSFEMIIKDLNNL